MTTPPSEVPLAAVSTNLTTSLERYPLDPHTPANNGTSITIDREPDRISAPLRPMLPVAGNASDIVALDDTQPVQSDNLGLIIPSAGNISQTTGGPVATDVSERIKAQLENVESRRIFADLFDNSDAAIIDHDFSALFRMVQALKQEGVRDLRSYIAGSEEQREKLVEVVRINNANAAALRMLGATSLQDLGKQSTNILAIAEAMFLGETRIRRSEYLVAGGTPIPVVYSLRIPRTEEEARRVPIVIMDLSDIRLAEAARQATAAKSQFLSSMSHEIRTPLNGVIGNLELLALTNLDSEQFELIDDADKAAKALLGLVGNILDFSKIEAGKLTAELGDINPAALVEEAVDVLQGLSRQKKIFISAIYGPDVPILVRGDAMRIRQILLNLIGNAVKFTDKGGVQVNLTVTAWDHNVCELRFEVHDSGRGFDQMLAAGLFETFTQERRPADGAEGTGLGLSICKSLVEAFGGAIGCDGVVGEGATFWFTMPMAVVRRAPSAVRLDLSGIRVMLIGDDKCARTRLADYFKSGGATIITQPAWSPPAITSTKESEDAPLLDIAVMFPEEGEVDTTETAWRLRERRIVPLLYAESTLPRMWLREGFAAMIQPETGTDHLDRNILLLVGHTQIRDRLAAQQDAVISVFGPALHGTKILVLEDRLVNQTVIQKQLKKLGIDCSLAINGLRGLETLERERFDLILCDCSMPEMNGYDFTRALRRREASAGESRHVPVIALTANAFREDADKCFEAGMDDFISKPVTMDRLAAMLTKWLSPTGSAPTPATRLQLDQSNLLPVIDMAALATILGGNEPEVLRQVLADFLATAAASLTEVEAAVSSGDAGRIHAAAHGAKGEARCAAATGLAEVYAELDRTVQDGDLAVSQALVSRATLELHRVEDLIRGHLRTH
jgi:signal transduction histidine kinase/CheY-like chemotaxis protein